MRLPIIIVNTRTFTHAICELYLAESRRIQGLSSSRQGGTIKAIRASDVSHKTKVLLPSSWELYLSSTSLQEWLEGVVCGNGRTSYCQATIQADGGFIADEVPIHLQTGVGIVNINRIEGRGMVALGALG
ncbi:hypothetical protein ASPFODRAFT_56732 [Aspergillus luchuensis CBS 106.47]|uniref:Uncharacterized protein n=1 Tax=Aspergillus luchuensis (strain CBS 106.47) TaxID=1137211 RepID=A0A1M3TUL0_ASPLC|nr:hypothetical protein ASPFODRAFT_56732 [Aspergillus luchuensis CBS 106.47]